MIENHLAVLDEILVVLDIVLQPQRVFECRQKIPEWGQDHVYPAWRVQVGASADRHCVAVVCWGNVNLKHHLRDSFLETNNVAGVGLA